MHLLKKLVVCTSLIGLLLASPLSFAIETSLHANRIVQTSTSNTNNRSGEKRTSADVVFKGDVVEYELVVSNPSTQSARAVQASLPVPKSAVYVPGSASPAPLLASIDGKTFEELPIVRTTTDKNGNLSQQVVAETEFRAVAWRISELAGSTNTALSMRVKMQ